MLKSTAQVQTALGAVLRDARARGLPCGVFGSFGWSGEAVDELDSRLKARWRLIGIMHTTADRSVFRAP